jgi:2-methylcitrate dehydratase PrpD
MGIPEGGMMDHYYSLINRNGIVAAQLAEAGGAPYSRYTIEGNTGLFRSFFGEVPAALQASIANLGHDWEIMTAEQKHYPGTGQNTVPIELLIELVKTEKLSVAQVVKIDVVQPDSHEAIDRKLEVSSRGPFVRLVQAYSSLPYALALVLLDGTVAMGRYADSANINDPEVAREMHKVVITDEDGHGPRYCRLTVHTKDGRMLAREIQNFSYPFPPSVWGEWLRTAGARLFPGMQLESLEHLVGNLDDLDDVASLMKVVGLAGSSN